jgi:hypothetical protein
VNCPHCADGLISLWRKTAASDLWPATCPNCKKLSHVSAWAHGLIAMLHEVALWGSVVCALLYQEWWALLIYPASLVLFGFLYACFFPLIVIDAAKVATARRRLAWQMGLAAITIITILMAKAISSN